MKKMPNIALTDKELETLLMDNNRFSYGGEAAICRNNNPHTLYKIFTEPGTVDEATEMSDNKYKKILTLYNNPREDTIEPISTISNRGVLIGYEISYDEDDESLLDMCLTYNEKIHYLRESSKILLSFAKDDITYGDIKSDNVLVNKNTGKVKLCDIDNIRIGEFPIDTMGYALSTYYEETGCIDEKADAYMHNIFFLEQLKYKNLSSKLILTCLATNPSMAEFPVAVQEIINTLIYPQKVSGEYAIEYLKK